jgi:kinesin family protein 2/24
MSNRRRSSVVPPKDQTRLKIERMEAEREERRRAMVERKKERAQEEQRNIAAGNPGDVDFIGMVRRWRQQHAQEIEPHDSCDAHPRICICVRKRPISEKERARNDHDSVTCLNPAVWIHSSKVRVDGITKYLDQTSFTFDHAFSEEASTEDVYKHTTMPLLDFVCSGKGGRATVFAYGQTGSGKTHTMNGIQAILCEDLYLQLSDHANAGGCSLKSTKIVLSFFEMYGGFVQDLLNDRNRLKVLEDGQGEIVVTGLQEVEADTVAVFHEIVNTGNSFRTTHTTEANDTSSRSHAICQILLRDKRTNKLQGKLSLVDLAGSERGTDTKSHNSQRRAESSDINTSLLALKECIRALDNKNKSGAKHVPYRSSKLTLILKDCFTSPAAMTTMIATVSPGASATDHSLNTLRYAGRIKEQRAGTKAGDIAKSPMRRKVSPRSADTSSTASDQLPNSLGLDEKTAVGEGSATRFTPRSGTNTMLRKEVLVRRSPSDDLDAVSGATQEETELRRTVQGLFEQEEAILSMHMRNIQENAELLTEEGKLLQEVQRDGVDNEAIEEYICALESVVERKETMILSLQEKLLVFSDALEKEQALSKKVGSLAQY